MIISNILPPAVLLATLMAYGSLSKFSEITAMKANGISLYRISLPALMFAAVMAVALFYFTEMITPASLQKPNTWKRLSFKSSKLWDILNKMKSGIAVLIQYTILKCLTSAMIAYAVLP
jgi:lipopolysaccharide export system permease protein